MSIYTLYIKTANLILHEMEIINEREYDDERKLISSDWMVSDRWTDKRINKVIRQRELGIVDYCHELQNLYHFLYGQELRIFR
jgi:hypothetical protein